MDMIEQQEELQYLLRYTKYCIDELICNVLEDSLADPEYSAVTAQNLIICFIRVQRLLGDPCLPNTVREYFLHCGNYSVEEYEEFQRRRVAESLYYRGVQYSE